MIRLLELLTARGLDVTGRVKMVRHEEARYPVEVLRREGQLDFYQGYQSRPIFECPHVVSFLGHPNRRAVLYGVFRVDGRSVADGTVPPGLRYPEWAAAGRYWYDLTRLDAFSDLEDRVVIDWGESTRSWHQWLREREVVEVLPTGYVREFPGYLDFVLSFGELRSIVHAPVANREWHTMLRAVAAVYLVVDRRTGRQYVGSAYGADGLLGRWEAYARTGHAGNQQLIELLAADPEYARHLDFTILQTLPRTATPSEVVACEQLHKRKLGSRVYGLNLN